MLLLGVLDALGLDAFVVSMSIFRSRSRIKVNVPPLFIISRS